MTDFMPISRGELQAEIRVAKLGLEVTPASKNYTVKLNAMQELAWSREEIIELRSKLLATELKLEAAEASVAGCAKRVAELSALKNARRV